MNDSLQSIQNIQEAGNINTSSTLLELLLMNHPIVIGIWIIIGVLVIVSIYLFFERYFTLQKYQKINPDFFKDLEDAIYNGKINSALELCKKNNSVEGRILLRGVRKIGKPVKEISDTIEDSTQLELLFLEKNVITLNLIGKIIFLLSIVSALVTIIISHFSTPSISFETIIFQPSISIALGLAISLLSYSFYCITHIKLKNTQYVLKSLTIRFLDILNRPV